MLIIWRVLNFVVFVDIICCQFYSPNCPPPVASFVQYRRQVDICRKSGELVVTITVKENGYYGQTKCSIPQDVEDPYHTIYNIFRVEDSPGRNRTKYCTVYLTSGNIQHSFVDLTVLLITSINDGQQENCGGPVTSQAKIKVNFKDCGNNPFDDRRDRILNTEDSTPDQGGSIRNQGVELSNTGIDQEAKLNYGILIGLVFIVTLIALSLLIGLIYFWCPDMCSICFKPVKPNNEDLNTTKILTVRDNFGQIIPEARTVEVWKTKENKVRTYDVTEAITKNNKRPKSRGGYNELVEEGGEYSNFNSREDTQRGSQFINTEETPRRIFLLEKSRTGGQRRSGSRLTLLREVNGSRLSQYPSSRRSSRRRSKKYAVKRKSDYPNNSVNVIEIDQYQDSSNIEVIKIPRPDKNDQLNYSRHYVSDQNRGDSLVINLDQLQREADFQFDKQLSNRDGRGSQIQGSVQVLKVHDDTEDNFSRKGSVHSEPRHTDRSMYNEPRKGGSVHSEPIRVGETLYVTPRDNQNESSIKRAISSISAIIEGDPSDYEEDNIDRQSYKSRSGSPVVHPTGQPEAQPEGQPTEEPLSSQIRKNLTPFVDTNRTPSPAVKTAANLLSKARNARKQRN